QSGGRKAQNASWCGSLEGEPGERRGISPPCRPSVSPPARDVKQPTRRSHRRINHTADTPFRVLSRRRLMAEIDHWHPVLSSKVLKDRPLPVRVAGHDLVVYRTQSGQIGALTDYCPHRRMRLSAGAVEGDRLRCRYHGWTYACDGKGES